MKKLILASIVALLSFSCSVSVPNNLTQEGSIEYSPTGHSSLLLDTSSQSLVTIFNHNNHLNHKNHSSDTLFTLHSSLDFSDLEKEYKSFSTKALSDAYVSRMFTKFLTTSTNPTQVIRQLEFARYLKDVKSEPSYFNSLKTFIGGDIAKFNLINNTAGVSQKKSTESATFGVFVDSLNPNTNNIVASGLVLNLDAGNASSYSGSGTIWTDLTGNGNNATLINGVGYSLLNTGSLVFDGVNDYLTFPKVNDYVFGSSDFAIGIWIKPNVILDNSFWNPIIGRWEGGSNDQSSWIIGFQSDSYSTGTIGGIIASIYTSTRKDLFSNNVIYNTQNWYNIIFTRVGTNIYLYINGILQQSADIGNASLQEGNLPLIVDGYQHEYGNDKRGNTRCNISNISIYKNKGLSSTEVLQNYNSLKGRYGL